MGSILSALRSVTKTLGAVFKLLAGLNRQYRAVIARANAAPGLPYEKPSNPYWLDDPPFPELADAQSEALPREADVVIIGSGITAAAFARSLFHSSGVTGIGGGGGSDGTTTTTKKPKVVVLEARALCSGATGRNGGHIKPSPQELFPRLARVHGRERGAALTRFTLRTAEAVMQVGQGREVAECRRVETVDFFLDDKGFEDARAGVDELRRWVPEVDIRVVGREEAKEEFGVDGGHVHGALTYPAGALWPYRLVTSVWRELLDAVGEGFLSIETHTPVEEITLDESEDDDVGGGGGDGSGQKKGHRRGRSRRGPYLVRTSRGPIRARHVVHATNAHASQFLPGLRGKMTGVKAHMTAQRPGETFGWRDGQKSWGVLYGGGMFDYATQRPNGDVMLGGGFGRSLGQGVDMVGVYDDGGTDGLTVAHVAGVMDCLFGDRWQGRLMRAWSGIICFTGDMAPFVGRIPGSVSGRKKGAAAAAAATGKTSLGLNSKTKTKTAAAVKIKVKAKGDDDGADVGSGEEVWEGAEAGEWISAGYCGDGMVWAWLCGTALGVMVAGQEGVALESVAGFPGGKLEEWFPRELLITEQRVKKVDLANLADELL